MQVNQFRDLVQGTEDLETFQNYGRPNWSKAVPCRPRLYLSRPKFLDLAILGFAWGATIPITLGWNTHCMLGILNNPLQQKDMTFNCQLTEHSVANMSEFIFYFGV